MCTNILCFSFASLYFVAAIQTTIIATRIIVARYFEEMVQMIVDISVLLYSIAFESKWL